MHRRKTASNRASVIQHTVSPLTAHVWRTNGMDRETKACWGREAGRPPQGALGEGPACAPRAPAFFKMLVIIKCHKPLKLYHWSGYIWHFLYILVWACIFKSLQMYQTSRRIMSYLLLDKYINIGNDVISKLQKGYCANCDLLNRFFKTGNEVQNTLSWFKLRIWFSLLSTARRNFMTPSMGNLKNNWATHA